ncbi:MAG: hypothetical protein ACPL7G_10170, partial [Chloroflexia bacterium]
MDAWRPPRPLLAQQLDRPGGGLLVHLSAVLPRCLDPLLDRAGLEAEPGFDGLGRSTVRYQG